MDINDIVTKKGEQNKIPPYGYVTNFAHGGLQYGDMIALDSLIDKVKRENIQLVDVGVSKGSSSAVMAFRAKELNGKVYSIDDYAPHPNFIDLYWMNIEYLGLKDYVELILEKSDVAYKRFTDKSIDLVFIDASHHYPEVVKDITNWLPKVKDGGIICGHDCQLLAKDGKVNLFGQELNLRPWQDIARETVGYDGQDIIINDHNICLHVGVILAVGDTLPDAQHISPNIWWKQIKN